jgi:clan AA aspartic protease
MTRATVSREFVLPAKPEDFVGEVKVPVLLENFDDVRDLARGRLAPSEVKSAMVNILVDTGASMLVLPQDLVEALRLETIERANVQYADGRHAEVDVAGIVRISVSGRSAETRCLVGPAGTQPLLGQIVLEMMDLLVDCPQRQLVPRPESPSRRSYSIMYPLHPHRPTRIVQPHEQRPL